MSKRILALAFVGLTIAPTSNAFADDNVAPPATKPSPVKPSSAKPSSEASSANPPVCDQIAKAAERYGLPVAYFTRLIWQESRFHPNALSPAGAQGVAQFMPRTAADRGLVDPYATREALLESAAYLSELRQAYGNLGLAAAAYNAGPGRVSQWLAGHAELPQETLNYVATITGHEASAWAAPTKPGLDDEKAFSCAHFAALAPTLSRGLGPSSAVLSKPWAVILVGAPARDKVLAEYQRVKSQFRKVLGELQPTVVRRRISGAMVPRFIVQIEQDTRAGANAVCVNLTKAGGNCFVLANR